MAKAIDYGVIALEDKKEIRTALHLTGHELEKGKIMHEGEQVHCRYCDEPLTEDNVGNFSKTEDGRVFTCKSMICFVEYMVEYLEK